MCRDESLSLRILSGFEPMHLYVGRNFTLYGQNQPPAPGQDRHQHRSPAGFFCTASETGGSNCRIHCGKKGETSAIIRKRVEKVQKIQEERYKDEKISFNGQLRSSLIDKYCPLTDSASKLLARAFERIAFSARSYHRILKVARTIADMEEEEIIATLLQSI